MAALAKWNRMADVAKIKSGLQLSNTVNRDGRSLGAPLPSTSWSPRARSWSIRRGGMAKIFTMLAIDIAARR